VKHSSTADGELRTSIDLQPTLRERIGPYCCNKVCSVWCSGGFRRRRWPIIGREGGLGGKFLLPWNTYLITRKIRKKKARQQ
jgi:hypothetical protein